ncbi:MAG TPA: thioredoxin family protein [Anaerolineaceae bacterium]|nr:thioredoxin family protein [Anaerolineaceae bacterium]
MRFRWNLIPLVLLALAITLTAWGFAPAPVVQAQAADGGGKIVIYFYWGEGCPHCAEAKPFLAELQKRYPQIELRAYEVWNNPDNQNKFQLMSQSYGFEAQYVPTIFIGEKYWVGYSDQIASEIEAQVAACAVSACPDPSTVQLDPNTGQFKDNIIDIPLIGKVDLDAQSLVLSTALIAFVDGVNPCSVWVLTMLLALVLHTGSRRKVVIIGLIFLTVTALIYALFIAGLFTVLKIASFVGWIQVVVAGMALVFGLINIKDYFWYKQGVSLTIADDKKPGIYQRMRGVLNASNSFWGLLGATIVLAAGVSLVEFSCTAGFPVIWANLMTAHHVSTLDFILLLVLYMIIYQADELVIFFVAVFTLRASKLEEKEGRILKLVGGVLMLTLAVVMLINPALMNSLGSSLIVFAIAFGVVLLVLLLHRKILPAFGIWIGSEKRKHEPRKPMKRH